MTFGELAAEYIQIKDLINLEETSKKNLYYSLTRTFLPEIGHLQAAGLTYKRLDAYVKKRPSSQQTVLRGSGKRKKRHLSSCLTANPRWYPDHQ
nr:hypothetical protein [uncultured Desulfobacter sp.]